MLFLAIAGATAPQAGLPFRIFLQAPPLIGGQDATESEQHAGVSFFEFSPSFGDAVKLREHGFLIEPFHGEKRFEGRLLLFHRRGEIDQLQTILLEFRIDALLLIGGEAEACNFGGIGPPTPLRQRNSGDSGLRTAWRRTGRATTPGTRGSAYWRGATRTSGRRALRKGCHDKRNEKCCCRTEDADGTHDFTDPLRLSAAAIPSAPREVPMSWGRCARHPR
jgi:hypothetical protein